MKRANAARADASDGASPGRGAPAGAALGAGVWALLLVASIAAALLLYRPALSGDFVSDDTLYIDNPLVRELTLDNGLRILDPTGDVSPSVSNYAPLHLLLHAAALQVFGDEPTGHHVVNVVLHALASVLLVALFLQSGLPRAAALCGGAIFLVHPANVEAVAWVSQLKSSAALVLALGALLAYPRRPLLASVCFALALLAKAHAVFVLPVAAGFEWLQTGRVRWRWLALWTLIFAGFSVAEVASHQRNQLDGAGLRDDPFVWLRTIVAIAMRYLVMAATALGVSAFHETEPARSPLDAWFLAGLAALAAIGWRLVATLRRRSVEAVFWLWALFAFAPVSQIFPFLYPMGDRYLYFILPGLIGAAACLARDLAEQLPARRRPAAGIVALAGVALLCAFFGWRSHQRAAIWRSAASLTADAAAHYPLGVSANLLRARRAAQAGDVDGVVAALRAAEQRGYNRFEQIEADPVFDAMRGQAQFQAVVSEIAAGWIVRGRARAEPTQQELQTLAHAHYVRGERSEAIATLRRALALGGARDPQIRADLEVLGAAPE